jgi:hypothetical protein
MMMNYNGFNIEKFENCCIYNKQDFGEKYGYSRSLTLEEMIPIAVEYRCPVIVRGGTNAKWYLKGNNKTEDVVREKISKSDMNKWKRRTLYFIPQLCLQEEELDTQRLEERISTMKRAVLVNEFRKEWKTKIDEKKTEIAAKQLELFAMEETAFIEEENISKMTNEEFSRRYGV